MKIIITVSRSSYVESGCVNCGCNYGYNISSGCGSSIVKCIECGVVFAVVIDSETKSFVKYGDDHDINVQDHPRKGIPSHKYIIPDIRPNQGEYFRSRGVGYDLAGFVRCKESGERIISMFKSILGNDISTWLDYREHEPLWIQVKVQKEDGIDLDILDKLTKDGIITYDKIVESLNKKLK